MFDRFLLRAGRLIRAFLWQAKFADDLGNYLFDLLQRFRGALEEWAVQFFGKCYALRTRHFTIMVLV
jgi:hypothetical protein